MARLRVERPKCGQKACTNKIRRSTTKYCSNKCQQKEQADIYITRWKQGLETGNINAGETGISSYVRNYLIEKAGNKCSSCEWSKVNKWTGKVPLTIEHKDGNWKNSKEENLEVLCYNCHSLTATFCSLNTGRGRRTALKKQEK
jgi:hypothetical protein